MMESAFRTLEVSNPAFEQESLRFISVKTPHLKGRGDICLFVPPEVNEKKGVPLVYLLHGVYGSCWSWAFQGGVHHTAADMIRNGALPPMVLVMPSDGLWGDGSGYLPHQGFDFERWIVEDVPRAVEEVCPQVTPDSPRFISGLSMGGFGALRLGSKYGDRFRGISAHSAITRLEEMALFAEEDLALYAQQDAAEESVLETMLRHRAQLPAIRFDCGEEDLLLQGNRSLHKALAEQHIPHAYTEYPGGHEWPYWHRYVRESLLFFARLCP